MIKKSKKEYDQKRITRKVINKQLIHDRLINTKINLQLGDLINRGKVLGRLVELDGIPKGSYYKNLMLYSVVHYVEVQDS